MLLPISSIPVINYKVWVFSSFAWLIAYITKMHTICKTTHLATGVEHSLYCNFYNKSENSLVVACSNILKIYRLNPEIPARTGRDEPEIDSPKVKLECLSTFPLHDAITSMASVSLNPNRDSLLLTFKDARLSVVEYDHNLHDLKTTSLHYFETDDLKGGFHFNHALPLVRVDPDTRCAAMLIYSKKIVILPFRKDLAKDSIDYNNPLQRGPIMQSYIIDPKEFDAPSIDNIIDIQFLHGYYDPTLMVLYEPIKTFPGRVAVRQDTCAIAALSLNLRQRLHPVIWNLTGLPHDCSALLPVPKPIGGVLLFAHNSLVYLTQSVPPYGISVNSLGDVNTNFPLRKQEGVIISLDGSRATFITEEKLVISLKGGELYVVTLVADSMKAVRSFHFDKAASSVLTCCVTVCEDNYLFLGSRLGNSLLLRFKVENETNSEMSGLLGAPAGDSSKVTIKAAVATNQPAAKRKKMDTLGDWIASDVDQIEDIDILEVYGPEDTTTSVQLSSYVFEVMDSLLNIGPCGDMSVGEPAFLSEEYDNANDPCVEIVTTSGYGKNGALSVLQRTIKPQVLTTFELGGVNKMWTVYGAAPVMEGGKRRPVDPLTTDHSYLILARDTSPLILHTQEEISELEDSGFNTSQPTIFAANIGNNRYIVQVRQFGVKLLEGAEEIQDIEGLSESPLVCGTVTDPYLAVLAEDGTVVVLTLVTRPAPKLLVSKSPSAKRLQIQTISAYCDVSGLFTTAIPDHGQSMQKLVKSEAELKKELDDEDEMLYGSANTSVFDPPKLVIENPKKKQTQAKWWKKHQKEHKPTYWLVGMRANGVMEIYTLPEMRLSFAVKDFPIAHNVLADFSQGSPTLNYQYPEYESKAMPTVHELLLVGMGNKKLRPVLFSRIGEDVVLYEAYHYSDDLDPMQLKLRFKKVLSHNMIMKQPRGKELNSAIGLVDRKTYFTAFSNISVYNGVFISGPSPHWVLLTVRGEFRFHAMNLDGGVKCFAPFRNVNCQNGFLYFNDKDYLRICLLPTILSYDAEWPVRKVPLRCTAHSIVHHMETKTYCVLTSISQPTMDIWKFNGDDKEELTLEREDRFIPVKAPKFSLQLFSPVNWQMIPNTDYELEKWEHVTACKNVMLEYEGDRSGLRGYICVATIYTYGEDITCKGRILLFDIIEVVPEPGQPLTKNKLKLLYEGEQKGPVTAITHCCGNLVTAIGQKLYIWSLKNNQELLGIAFIDTQIYIHRLITLKSIILAADVCKSITVLRFEEENRTISLVAKDLKPMQVYNAEYIVDGNRLAFIASDADKNIVIMKYAPENRESAGGTRLVRKGDYHLGSHVNTFFRIKCRVSDTSTSNTQRKHLTMMATLDGSLAYVLPINERVHKRLQILQNHLLHHVAHYGGLNPKACRTFKSRHKFIYSPMKHVLDGDLLWRFIHLPLPEKIDLAKKCASSIDEILNDFREIDRSTAHF